MHHIDIQATVHYHSFAPPGSGIQTPKAIVILFGLLSPTALDMIVVPAL